ncbi:MAG TPA: chorismate-binding protein, partial [Bacteroidota bacterium]
MTSFEEFKALCGQGNVIPVYERLSADTETPISVYRKIRNRSPYSFLLESVEGGEQLARYSFVGCNPFMKFTVEGLNFSVEALHDDVHVLPTLVNPDDHPLEALKKLFSHIRTVRIEGLPRFIGGAVGYFAYESVGLVESVPQPSGDDLGIPDAELLFFDVLIVIDNATQQLVLISNAYIPSPAMSEEALRKEYDKAAGEIREIKTLLARPMGHTADGGSVEGRKVEGLSKTEYCSLVDRAKQYILDGDIFQVVLSQRIRQDARVDPFELYRNLRRVNPSPYLYYLQLDTAAVIGSSPEMLVRVEQGVVQTRPIAGTRRRGRTAEEDKQLEQELLADPKERAEHLMLV